MANNPTKINDAILAALGLSAKDRVTGVTIKIRADTWPQVTVTRLVDGVVGNNLVDVIEHLVLVPPEEVT